MSLSLQEKKKDLLLELEEYDRRIRMKSLGNIRFIGKCRIFFTFDDKTFCHYFLTSFMFFIR